MNLSIIYNGYELVRDNISNRDTFLRPDITNVRAGFWTNSANRFIMIFTKPTLAPSKYAGKIT